MSITRLNYSTYDLDVLTQQMQERLRSRYDSWKDIYRSGDGEMLIEFLAAVVNMGLYYTERLASEPFITTARNRSSIVNMVALINYQPKRKTSSIGTLQFSIETALSKIVYIPRYTECESVGGIKYLTNESAAIEKGQTSVSVNGIQGELIQTEVTSNGLSNQEYSIKNTDIENSADIANPTFRITVNGVQWTKVDSFINSDNASKHFRLINEMDGTVSVQFGDNINGVSPLIGSKIAIQYIKSAGLEGNVTYTDKITTLNSTIFDEDGTAVTVTVTNTSAFLGGDDEEDIEEIRYEAPRVFKTGDRAVNKIDFVSILENYPGVVNANVWGENEEAEITGEDSVAEMLNTVKICIILQEWELPDATFKSTLSNYLYNKSMITVKYEYVEPVFLNVIPVLDVNVATSYSLSQTQADIEEILAGQFELGNTTKLGTIIKYSNVIAAINDLEGVAWVNMILEIKKELSDSYSSFCTFGEDLDALPILPSSVRIFVDGTYVTTDDGEGNFSYLETPNISGTIDYETGQILLDISPKPDAVYVRYQQTDEEGNRFGNIAPSLNNIAKLDSVDIQNISME